MIKKAILPVAGLGTRFLPATKAQPKEMLPVFDTPAIQFIVEEAVAAGIEEIIIVIGPGKSAIKNHFEPAPELESILEARGKLKELEIVRHISSMANFHYVQQDEPLGDGHAILCAEDFLEADESVVVLFGDDLVDNEAGKNAVEQLLSIYQEKSEPVILLNKIQPEETKKYGVVGLDEQETQQVKINKFIEKPEPEEAPSDLGVVGKFILTPEIITLLKQQKAGSDGEIRLAQAFDQYLQGGEALWGKVLEGQRFDTGDKQGFLAATLHYAKKHL